MTPVPAPEPSLAAWTALWSEALGGTPFLPPAAQAELERTHSALLAAYREPQRHYHTLQHLQECLAWFASVRGQADHPAELGLALWFHDAIYEVRAHDNESLSAEWALRVAQAIGLPTDSCTRLKNLVLVTRHDAAAATPDEQRMVDIDLAILGAAPARFDEYEAQVRQEYDWVPGALFRSKRRSILQAFLDRRPLFHTPALADRLEVSARTNLRRSLQALDAA